MTSAYTAGAQAALVKLGLLDRLDAEDVPDWASRDKYRQLRQLYMMRQSLGFPGGGNIAGTYALQAQQNAPRLPTPRPPGY